MKPQVFFTGWDAAGWAIDEDLRLTKEALAGVVQEAPLHRADLVHGVFWNQLIAIPKAGLREKHVFCHADNAPFFYITEPEFMIARQMVDTWIARSHEAMQQFSALGLCSRYVPYTMDPLLFRPLGNASAEQEALRRKWHIPQDRYVIANFHRDTEGQDLTSPKLQKGPDIFLEIVRELHRSTGKMHVLLAGPRRFWLRRKLEAAGVPHSFVGREMSGDDYPANILSREQLNSLYNLADLVLITSRWEGGPQAIMEAAAAKRKILSTRVGLAEDILAQECIYDSIAEAVEKIGRDMEANGLEDFVEAQFERVQCGHTPAALRESLTGVYADLPGDSPHVCTPKLLTVLKRVLTQLKKLVSIKPRVAVLCESKKCSDFFLQLQDALIKRGGKISDSNPTVCIVGDWSSPLPNNATIIRAPQLVSDEEFLLNSTRTDCMVMPSIESYARWRDRLPARATVIPSPIATNDALGIDSPPFLRVAPSIDSAADRFVRLIAMPAVFGKNMGAQAH